MAARWTSRSGFLGVGRRVLAGHAWSECRSHLVGRKVLLRSCGIARSSSVFGWSGRQYPKAAFPRETVFGAESGQVLRLVPCGGSFDAQRRRDRDNLVVEARLTSWSRA